MNEHAHEETEPVKPVGYVAVLVEVGIDVDDDIEGLTAIEPIEVTPYRQREARNIRELCERAAAKQAPTITADDFRTAMLPADLPEPERSRELTLLELHKRLMLAVSHHAENEVKTLALAVSEYTGKRFFFVGGYMAADGDVIRTEALYSDATDMAEGKAWLSDRLSERLADEDEDETAPSDFCDGDLLEATLEHVEAAIDRGLLVAGIETEDGGILHEVCCAHVEDINDGPKLFLHVNVKGLLQREKGKRHPSPKRTRTAHSNH